MKLVVQQQDFSEDMNRVLLIDLIQLCLKNNLTEQVKAILDKCSIKYEFKES